MSESSEIATIREKNQITIPNGVMRQLKLSIGDYLVFITDGGPITLNKGVLVVRKDGEKKK